MNEDISFVWKETEPISIENTKNAIFYLTGYKSSECLRNTTAGNISLDLKLTPKLTHKTNFNI